MSSAAATPFSDAAVLETWDEAASAGPVERALALGRAAATAAERDGIEHWSIGRRDRLLLDAHAATFGDPIAGATACPECEEPLELSLRASELRTDYGDADETYDLVAADRPIRFRLPSSGDLLLAAAAVDVSAGLALVLERCLVFVDPGGLSNELVSELAGRMAACDPQSDVRLALTCPACEYAWSLRFDIADFLWREVDDRARQLLSEIATLAAAFGWEERHILDLGANRREHYLGLIGR